MIPLLGSILQALTYQSFSWDENQRCWVWQQNLGCAPILISLAKNTFSILLPHNKGKVSLLETFLIVGQIVVILLWRINFVRLSPSSSFNQAGFSLGLISKLSSHPTCPETWLTGLVSFPVMCQTGLIPINPVKGDNSDSELNAGCVILTQSRKWMKERRKPPCYQKLFLNL